MHHFPLFISLQGFTSSPLFGRLGQRRQKFAFDNLFVLANYCTTVGVPEFAFAEALSSIPLLTLCRRKNKPKMFTNALNVKRHIIDPNMVSFTAYRFLFSKHGAEQNLSLCPQNLP